jgi:hypothetical protein
MGDSLYFEAVNAANAYGVPSDLFTSLIGAESGWNPNALSSAGAEGVAQFMPSTAVNPGYGIASFNPWNPQASLNAAAQYLAALKNQFGSWTQAVAAYWAGPGTVATNPATTYPSNAVNTAAAVADAGNAQSGTADGPVTNPSPNASPSTKQAASGCAGWLSTPAACGMQMIASIGYVILAVVLIGAGLYLLKDR